MKAHRYYDNYPDSEIIIDNLLITIHKCLFKGSLILAVELKLS